MNSTALERIIEIDGEIAVLAAERLRLVDSLKALAIQDRPPDRKLIISGAIYDGQIIWPKKIFGLVTHRIYRALYKMHLHQCVTRKYKIAAADWPAGEAQELLISQGISLGLGSPRLIITPKRIAKLHGINER